MSRSQSFGSRLFDLRDILRTKTIDNSQIKLNINFKNFPIMLRHFVNQCYISKPKSSHVIVLLPGNFCRGMPFALKGDWQLGRRMIFVLFLAKFHNHLAWQSQCNGLPPSCNKLSERTTSSFKTKFLRLHCSKLRDSKPDIPVKELAGNSETKMAILYQILSLRWTQHMEHSMTN